MRFNLLRLKAWLVLLLLVAHEAIVIGINIRYGTSSFGSSSTIHNSDDNDVEFNFELNQFLETGEIISIGTKSRAKLAIKASTFVQEFSDLVYGDNMKVAQQVFATSSKTAKKVSHAFPVTPTCKCMASELLYHIAKFSNKS